MNSLLLNKRRKDLRGSVLVLDSEVITIPNALVEILCIVLCVRKRSDRYCSVQANS